MAQITWRNIATPNFGSANQLLTSGQDQITSGLETLGNIAREQEAEGTEANTQALLQQLAQAGSIEEAQAIDLSQYGTGVDAEQLTQGLQANLARLRDEERTALEDERYEASVLRDEAQTAIQNQRADAAAKLAQERFEFQKNKWGQPQVVQNPDGSTQAYQFNAAGEMRTVDELGRPAQETPQTKLNNLLVQTRNRFASEGKSDTSAYKAEVTKLADEAGLVLTPDTAEQYAQGLADRTGLTEPEQELMTEADNRYQEVNQALIANHAVGDQQVEKAFGYPVDVFDWSEGPKMSLKELTDAEVTSDSAWFSSNVDTVKVAHDIVSTELGEVTEQELKQLLSKSLDITGGTFFDAGSRTNTDALKQAAKEYKTLLGNSKARQVILQWNQAKTRDTANLSDQHRQRTNKMRGDFVAKRENPSLKVPDYSSESYIIPTSAAAIREQIIRDVYESVPRKPIVPKPTNKPSVGYRPLWMQ